MMVHYYKKCTVMAQLRFPEVFGSNQVDNLTAASQQIVYGYSGHDPLTAEPYTEMSFLIGGPGDEHYHHADGSIITILDSAGSDTLFSAHLGLDDPNTYVATVENQHLIAVNIESGAQVAIGYWLDPQYAIDHYVLSDGSYTHADIVAAVQSTPNNIGDFSVTELSHLGVLPAGTSEDDLNDLIQRVLNTE